MMTELFDKLQTEMDARAKRQQAEIETLTAATGMTAEELDADVTAPDPGGEDGLILTPFRLTPEERAHLNEYGNMTHRLREILRRDMARKAATAAKGESGGHSTDS